MNTGFYSKLGWELKVKSIHWEKLFKIGLGSFISWCKPFCEVTASIFLPSSLVISLLYQLLDLALKSPASAIKKGFFWDRVSKINSKLSRNEKNHHMIGQVICKGEWNYVLCHRFVTRKKCFHEIWYQRLLMVGNFYNTNIHLHVYY